MGDKLMLVIVEFTLGVKFILFCKLHRTTIPPEIVGILACEPKGHNDTQSFHEEQTETMQLTRGKYMGY